MVKFSTTKILQYIIQGQIDALSN